MGRSHAEFGILISCVGRKMVLKQRVEEEVEGVADVLGGTAALTGFYSYGEISPFANGATLRAAQPDHDDHNPLRALICEGRVIPCSRVRSNATSRNPKRYHPSCNSFLDAVDAAYHEFDLDRGMLERSMELSSAELLRG